MTIVTVEATASHRYYVKRAKRDIIARINAMRYHLNLEPMLERDLMLKSADSLASLAMEHHRMFPEKKNDDNSV